MSNRTIAPITRLFRPSLECDPQSWPGSLFRRVAVSSIRRALKRGGSQVAAAELLGLDPTRLGELLRDFPECKGRE